MVAENNQQITQAKYDPSVNLIPWQKGQSGNPGGRPKGLASLIRERTAQGQELVDIMLEIARGTMECNGFEPRHQDRIESVKWLADRGFGKGEIVTEGDDASTFMDSLATVVARKLLMGDTSKVIDVAKDDS